MTGQIRAGQPWECLMPTVCPVVPLLPRSEDLVLTVCLARSWAQGNRDGRDLGCAFGVLSLIWRGSMIMLCQRCPGRPEEGP